MHIRCISGAYILNFFCIKLWSTFPTDQKCWLSNHIFQVLPIHCIFFHCFFWIFVHIRCTICICIEFVLHIIAKYVGGRVTLLAWLKSSFRFFRLGIRVSSVTRGNHEMQYIISTVLFQMGSNPEIFLCLLNILITKTNNLHNSGAHCPTNDQYKIGRSDGLKVRQGNTNFSFVHDTVL